MIASGDIGCRRRAIRHNHRARALHHDLSRGCVLARGSSAETTAASPTRSARDRSRDSQSRACFLIRSGTSLLISPWHGSATRHVAPVTQFNRDATQSSTVRAKSAESGVPQECHFRRKVFHSWHRACSARATLLRCHLLSSEEEHAMDELSRTHERWLYRCVERTPDDRTAGAQPTRWSKSGS